MNLKIHPLVIGQPTRTQGTNICSNSNGIIELFSSAPNRCWMNDSHTQWILTVPVCLSLLGSLGFLINVVRVLLTKLHCNSANPAPIGLRKAVRAAFILVPLFGIHHILIPFRPEPHEPLERAYQIFSALLVSSQVTTATISVISMISQLHNVYSHYVVEIS